MSNLVAIPLLFDWITDPLGSLGDAISQAIGNFFIDFFTFWLQVPAPVSAYGEDGASGIVQQQLLPLVALIATGALIAAAARLAMTRRVDPMLSMVKGILTLVIVTFSGLFLVQALVRFSNSATNHILNLNENTVESLGARVGGLFMLTGSATGLHNAIIIYIVLGLIVIVIGAIQLFLLFLRDGAIIVLAGVLPLAAVGTMIPGTNWFMKVTGWMMAFIFYKPTAAMVYLAAFALMGNNAGNAAESLRQFFLGIIMLMLSLLVLPALMRLFDWTTSHVGGASGGAVLSSMAGGAASGAMAASMMSGGGGEGGGGSSGADSGGMQDMAKAVSQNMAEPPEGGASGASEESGSDQGQSGGAPGSGGGSSGSGTGEGETSGSGSGDGESAEGGGGASGAGEGTGESPTSGLPAGAEGGGAAEAAGGAEGVAAGGGAAGGGAAAGAAGGGAAAAAGPAGAVVAGAQMAKEAGDAAVDTAAGAMSPPESDS